jgi:hypothetical protein
MGAWVISIRFRVGAHNFSGKADLIIDLGSQKYWEIVSCFFSIDETRCNIMNKFPGFLERLDSLLTNIKKVPSGRVTDTRHEHVIF